MVTINNNGLLQGFQAHLSGSALAPATVINYLADLRAFLRWSEATKGENSSPFSLTSEDVYAYCLYLQKARCHARSTVNRRLQALRKFYDFAMAQGWIFVNPADSVPLLADVSPQRSQCRSASEVERVLAALHYEEQEWASRDWAIVQVLLGAGLKLRELICLNTVDVHLDGDRPYLQVCDGSDGQARSRTVPLDGAVSEALRSYLPTRQAAPGVDRFFVNQDGNPLSTRSVQRLLHDCARLAGLDGLTAQDLRYIYARTVYAKCGDVRKVAQLLGHRHLATTVRYLRPDSNDSN